MIGKKNIKMISKEIIGRGDKILKKHATIKLSTRVCQEGDLLPGRVLCKCPPCALVTKPLWVRSQTNYSPSLLYGE